MKNLISLIIVFASFCSSAQNMSIEYFQGSKNTSFPTKIDEFVCNCMDDSSYSEVAMIRCLEVTSDQWEAKIDVYYNYLMKIIDSEYNGQLMVEQISWMKTRNEQLKFASLMFVDRQVSNGYHMQLINYYKMKVKINRDRAMFLEYYYNN